MRKRNKVKVLQRTHEHREAMLSNMAVSLFFHEQITTTVAKAKVTSALAEKLITRAKKNLVEGLSEPVKVHNLRMAAKVINNKEVLHKLFDDIAKRFATRAGGYTRIIKLGKRNTDASEMAILQLVDKKELVILKEERKALRAKRAEVSGKAKEKKLIGKEMKKQELIKKKELKAAKAKATASLAKKATKPKAATTKSSTKSTTKKK